MKPETPVAPDRRGHRHGFYRRRLVTPQRVLSIRGPRARGLGLDRSFVFDRSGRRQADVDRILRRVFLAGVSTRAAAERVVFGQLARWHLLPEITHKT